jgi:hypothetical protein
MRRVVFALTVLLMFAIGPLAHAEVFNLDPVQDPLGDCSQSASPDECMGVGTTTASICSDSWGCPMCGMNQNLTKSVCYRLFGNWGYCRCQPDGIYVDKWGRTMPKCKSGGSCTVR